MERQSVTRVWCEQDGELLLHRAAAGAKRFASMHELPTAELAGIPADGRLLAQKRRGITRFQITELIHAAPAPSPRRKLGPELVWVPIGQLDTITLSGPHRRWVNEILRARLPPK